MKTLFRNMLRLSGAISVALSLAGCAADAEQTSAETNATQAVTAVKADANANTAPETVLTNTVVASTNAIVAGTNVMLTATAGDTNAIDPNLSVVATIPPTPPPNIHLSKGVEEIIKLSQSDVSDAVVLLYVEKASEKFDLDANEIVYLNDLGISQDVIAAMLKHDGEEADVQHAIPLNSPTLAGTTSSTTGPAAVPNIPLANVPGANVGAVQPSMEVSSNYVADPNAQPSLAVQQQPVVVQQPVIVQDQPTVVYTSPAETYSYFYSSLSPYGSWVMVPDYGWCWQPTVALSYHGWRPYCQGGRWLYSDCGWYWQSDYSWGWAPFHYGRWFSSPHRGWVWCPDFTWGPSWVTWRRGAEYCGWAPLPPRTYCRPGVGFSYYGHDVGFSFSFGYTSDHYTFVPTRHFTDRHLASHVVASTQSGNIYHNSTVVNNYIVGNNNTIVNNGIGRDYVASHTRSEIRRVSVQTAPTSAGTRIAPDRVQRQGSDLVVYRPTPPAPDYARQRETLVRNERERNVAALSASSRSASVIRPSTTTRVEGGSAVTRPSSPRAAEEVRRQSGSSPSTTTPVPSRLASRGNEAPPVWTRPEPVRVRPEPTLNSVPARTVPSRQNVESVTRTPTSSAPAASGSPTITPGSRPSTAGSRTASETRTVPPTRVNPSPSPTPPTRTGTPASRNPNAVTPARPSPQAGNSTSQMPVVQPSTQAPSRNPAVTVERNRSESFRPNTRLAEQNVPSTTFSRPNVESSATPPARLSPAQQPTRLENNPSFNAGSVAARQPDVSPDSVRSVTPSVRTITPMQPSLSPRAESMNGNRFGSSQIQRPPTTIFQSRGITPLPSTPRSIPSYSAPSPQVTAPSRSFQAPSVSSPNIQSVPSRGGNMSPAPSVSPPARTIQPSSPSRGESGGRGRLEIGR